MRLLRYRIVTHYVECVHAYELIAQGLYLLDREDSRGAGIPAELPGDSNPTLEVHVAAGILESAVDTDAPEDIFFSLVLRRPMRSNGEVAFHFEGASDGSIAALSRLELQIAGHTFVASLEHFDQYRIRASLIVDENAVIDRKTRKTRRPIRLRLTN